MQINYILENEARVRLSRDEGLSGSEWLVWEALYYIFNQRAKGSDYPDGFIRVPNKLLLSIVPVQYDAMANARNKLKQRGLIDYVQGKKNTDPPMYKLNYLTAPQVWPDDDVVDNPVDKSVENPGYPFFPDNIPDKTPGKPTGKTPGNIPGKTANIYPNITYLNVCKQGNQEEEEEVIAHEAGCLAYTVTPGAEPGEPDGDPSADDQKTEMARAIGDAMELHYGSRGTPGLRRRLAMMMAGLDFSTDMGALMIEEAALRQVKDIFAFAQATVTDWCDDDIRTPDEYYQRRYLLDLASGKVDGVHHDVQAELMDIRQRRREAHKQATGGRIP